ncbi:MAG: peptidase T [Deltaproteobacteria bacterium]|nr:peptidase T [Deltaproteobacteria bacterium]
MKKFDDYKALLKETRIVERFVEYVQIETTSDEHVERFPSTDGQLGFGRKLVEELKGLGLAGAGLDENGYVTATLPGKTDRPAVGLIAHLDTSPAAPGKDVKPVFHESYDGRRIELKDGVVIDPADNPELKRCIGDTIITSDGTTLLGADDKAGIAVIMGALRHYQLHPDTPRPTIKVAFTPDEEIGKGASRFPLERFGADVAFTLDGTFDGEINIETFNAHSAFVTFTGVATHPGTAKGKMVNALRHMGVFLDRLPRDVSPEHTSDRQGFIHPYEVNGDAGKCKCHLILRDFDEDKLAALGARVREVAAGVAAQEPRLKHDVEIKPSYPNMYKFLKDKPEILERLREAVRRSGIEPDLVPIRGGTDGAHLTRMGMPTPNVFAGGMNFHGQTEWISTRSMGLSLCTVLNLMVLYAG